MKNNLSIQLVLPEDYKHNQTFQENLKVLRELGLFGVELNMANYESFDVTEIVNFLGDYNLKFTNFATGLTAQSKNLSLSSSDLSLRKKSIKELLKMGSKFKSQGIIVGFLKGLGDLDLFIESLKEVLSSFQGEGDILIEATNRYESNIVNTLYKAHEVVQAVKALNLKILPDTFHMNIEESMGYKALKPYKEHFNSLHISDNNRFFPGMGCIDFKGLFDFLKRIDYSGDLVIEGNIKNSFILDITTSVKTIRESMR